MSSMLSTSNLGTSLDSDDVVSMNDKENGPTLVEVIVVDLPKVSHLETMELLKPL